MNCFNKENMNNLKETIKNNFNIFVRYFYDNISYEYPSDIFIKEIILNYYTTDNFKFLIEKNNLFITICNVNVLTSDNITLNKVGCIKTELDEVLNNSGALQISKCYLDIDQFNN